MKFIFIIVFIATACSTQNPNVQETNLPDINEIVEYLEVNPLPLPDFINDVTTEVSQVPAKICINFNNGVLGQYSEEQTMLIKNNSSMYINMRKQTSLEYYENMVSLTDSDGKHLDTGISEVCSTLSNIEEIHEKFLVYFELNLPSDHHYIYMWTVQKP